MRRVLIAGCGYVGTATGALLRDHGWDVVGWTATGRQTEGADFPLHAVDLTDRAAVMAAAAAAAERFDAIVQCASSRGGDAAAYRRIYLQAARNLIEAFPRVPLVFTSSTSVYGQRSGEWVTEESPTEPTRETGRILLEAESLVLAAGGTVARLAGIYGPGRSALLRKMIDGTAVLDRGGERFVNQIHRDDVASALRTLLERAGAGTTSDQPHIYNVSDGNPRPLRDCYTWLAAMLNQPVPPVRETAGPRKRGDTNKRVRNEKLTGTGWRPQYPTFETGMTESVLPQSGIRRATEKREI